MKVLMVNPWTGNIAQYTHGLCLGLSRVCDLTLVTNCHDLKHEDVYRVVRLFFCKSETSKRGVKRKIVRGLEYIDAYRKIFNIIREEKFDVVHIQWCLMYDLDLLFIRNIRRYAKVVITVHNVLPHVKGEKYKIKLGRIYKSVDSILVHGKSIRSEFLNYYPEYIEKVRIQMHGCITDENISIEIDKIPKEIKDRVEAADRVIVFIGNILYNKGVDILLKVWNDHYSNTKDMLIVAGRTTENYRELEIELDRAKEKKNIIILNEYIEDNFLNYIVNSAAIVVLPYRHASMSGVVFKAAQFRKPIICTNTGSITEYVRDGEDCIVCLPTEDSLNRAIDKTCRDFKLSYLENMGNRLHNHIYKEYSWDAIARGLEKTYREISSANDS